MSAKILQLYILYRFNFCIRQEANNGCYKYLNTCEKVSTLTSALKLFLRELRPPLISREAIDSPLPSGPVLSSKLCLLSDDYCDGYWRSEIMAQIKSNIRLLPVLEQKVLHYILLHLKSVADNEENKMDASSLAIIFGQNLVESKPMGNRNMDEVMIETDCNNKFVEILITHVQELFLDQCVC